MAFPAFATAKFDVEIPHGGSADAIHYLPPHRELRLHIAEINQPLVGLHTDGAVLDHVVQLAPYGMIVIARDPGPEFLLFGFESAFHVVFKRCPSRGGPDTASLVGR